MNNKTKLAILSVANWINEVKDFVSIIQKETIEVLNVIFAICLTSVKG